MQEKKIRTPEVNRCLRELVGSLLSVFIDDEKVAPKPNQISGEGKEEGIDKSSHSLQDDVITRSLAMFDCAL